MNNPDQNGQAQRVPAIIVHGGATTIKDEERPAYEAGCLRALETGWKVIDAGGNAADAVEAAIRVFEDDPTFNAGYGSALNHDGMVEMDAAIMEGSKYGAGAVAVIAGVRHPISVARKLLDEQAVLLAGHGARRYAMDNQIDLCDPLELITEKQRRAWQAKEINSHDTVGCVALDSNGNLASGASTGGLVDQEVGRVGDSPQLGSGLYADDDRGAVAVSGDGEEISRVNLSRSILDCLRLGLTPDDAVSRAIAEMADRVGGEAGSILLTPEGEVGWAHNSSDFAVAYRAAGMSEGRAYTRKDQEGGPA